MLRTLAPAGMRLAALVPLGRGSRCATPSISDFLKAASHRDRRVGDVKARIEMLAAELEACTRPALHDAQTRPLGLAPATDQIAAAVAHVLNRAGRAYRAAAGLRPRSMIRPQRSPRRASRALREPDPSPPPLSRRLGHLPPQRSGREGATGGEKWSTRVLNHSSREGRVRPPVVTPTPPLLPVFALTARPSRPAASRGRPSTGDCLLHWRDRGPRRSSP